MASITEVARLAGVSPATASRVVSASDYPVSAATRAKVLEAARELDYVPNALARGLLKSRVPVVAVIVHDITDPYFAEVVRGVEDAASSAGRSGCSRCQVPGVEHQAGIDFRYLTGLKLLWSPPRPLASPSAENLSQK